MTDPNADTLIENEFNEDTKYKRLRKKSSPE
jgi:hypothetical protein